MPDFKDGYNHAIKTLGSSYASINSGIYVSSVEDAINIAISNLKTTSDQYINNLDMSRKGFIAEDFLVGTFNINVAVKQGIGIEAAKSINNNPFTDVIVNNNGNISQYQLKFYNNAEATAKALSNPKYDGIGKIAPSDQVGGNNGVEAYAMREAQRNIDIRPDVSNSYLDTAENVKGILSEKGYSSDILTNEQALKIGNELKNGNFDPEKWGLTTNQKIDYQAILDQSLKAGITAATITMMLKIAPEIYKAIEQLIVDGEVDREQFSKIGIAALTGGAEGFLRGFIAASLTTAFKTGAFGSALKTINPVLIGSTVALLMNVMQNSYQVANGKMTRYEFANQCAKDTFITVFSLGVGGITQSLIPQLPIIAFMFGSFVGSIMGGFVFNVSESLIMSFCVDSGFTFFGCVEQNYELPSDLLKELGFHVTEFDKIKHDYIQHKTISHKMIEHKYINHHTIDIKVLKRGIIGVNKVGYII